MTPADMARLNKELSDLGPVVDSIQLLNAKRDEVRCVGCAVMRCASATSGGCGRC